MFVDELGEWKPTAHGKKKGKTKMDKLAFGFGLTGIVTEGIIYFTLLFDTWVMFYAPLGFMIVSMAFCIADVYRRTFKSSKN